MFVKETHFSSRSGLGAAAGMCKQGCRPMCVFQVLPLDACAPAPLGPCG